MLQMLFSTMHSHWATSLDHTTVLMTVIGGHRGQSVLHERRCHRIVVATAWPEVGSVGVVRSKQVFICIVQILVVPGRHAVLDHLHVIGLG